MSGSGNGKTSVAELRELLARMSQARVCVFGDFCLDAYWVIDGHEYELSAETRFPVQHVREQRYSLGGAGNVVANLAALGVGQVRGIGLIGDDLFGWELRRLIGKLGVNAQGLLVRPEWQTGVFGKPHRLGQEHNRIDFGAFSELSPPLIDELAATLDAAAGHSDVVIINQQLPRGVTTAAMIERINAVIAGHPGTRFIVDSRDRAGLFRGATLKMNVREAAGLLGRDDLRPDEVPLLDVQKLARAICERTKRPAFITCGPGGIVVSDGRRARRMPGVVMAGQELDTVGAGDTVVSAVAAAIAVGGDEWSAARLANLAASVTIRKLGVTGTATPEEILAAAGAIE
jgi:rfaE bifunctional protein kinase chain/domain